MTRKPKRWLWIRRSGVQSLQSSTWGDWVKFTFNLIFLGHVMLYHPVNCVLSFYLYLMVFERSTKRLPWSESLGSESEDGIYCKDKRILHYYITKKTPTCWVRSDLKEQISKTTSIKVTQLSGVHAVLIWYIHIDYILYIICIFINNQIISIVVTIIECHYHCHYRKF